VPPGSGGATGFAPSAPGGAQHAAARAAAARGAGYPPAAEPVHEVTDPGEAEKRMKGFRNFLMRGDVIVTAVGLSIALAFSGLVAAFTASIINPLVNAIQPGSSSGLGVYVRDHKKSTFINFGSFISAIIYFIIFIAVVYFLVVVPYRRIQARRGNVVFGDPPPTKTCPACLSSDLPVAASKCKYCGTDQPATA
jgi:large conductance mechanosensitive channel